MKKLMLAAMLAVGATASAQKNYIYMTVDCGQIEKTMLLESVRKITFENGQMVVTTSDGNQAFLQSETNRVCFSETATTVAPVRKETPLSSAVYDLCGRKISIVGDSESRLKKGLYIVEGRKILVK